MARAGTANSKPEAQAPAPSAMHQLREVVAVLMFCGIAALVLYGTWLGIFMHFSKTMPAWAIGRILGCAVVAAALYTVACRIEPLPVRRRRHGKRWINVGTPTQRQIWETAPGDFVECVLAAIGIIGILVMLFIDFFLVMGDPDVLDMIVALTVGAGAFALEGVFRKWRGRSMFDPPGKPLPPREEKEPKQTVMDHGDVDVGASASHSDSSGHDTGSGSDSD